MKEETPLPVYLVTYRNRRDIIAVATFSVEAQNEEDAIEIFYENSAVIGDEVIKCELE